MEVIYHQQSPTNHQASLTSWSKRIYYTALDADNEIFVVHMAIWERKKIVVDPGRKAQIEAQSKAQVGALLFNKTFIEVLAEYSNYNNVFLAENAAELLKNTEINEHAIKLKEGKQLLFRHIYSLGPVELETLKTYIENILANGFIRPSKFPAEAPILFDWKLDRSLRLCMDYWGLNNITIKIRYPLPLIG